MVLQCRNELRKYYYCVFCVFLFITVSESKLLWKLTSEDESTFEFDKNRLRNRRLEGLEKIEKNHFVLPQQVTNFLKEGDKIDFQLPQSPSSPKKRGILEKSCVLDKPGVLVPPKLAEKFEKVKIFGCLLQDGSELHINIDTTRKDGFRATYFGNDRETYYIDSAVENSEEYLVYNTKDARKIQHFDLETFNETVSSLSSLNLKTKKLEKRTLTARIYDIAVIANNEYSRYHGGTKESVFNSIVTLFQRINGVYSRELGFYFRLIEKTDALICLPQKNDIICSALRNDYEIMNQNMFFLQSKGVSFSDYDLGHSLTTGSGGAAQYPSVCEDYYKARATTGLSRPEGDVFAVDYVSHEIGHQFWGPHVFRDCEGKFDWDLMLEGAVEPGSGSSIMGYAGICGDRDIQSTSDPYFNGLNLKQIYSHAVFGPQCGEVIEFEREMPTLTTFKTSCRVPIGNYFQLSGKTTTREEDRSYFSWERIDPAFEDFKSNSEGKFRSWPPVKQKERFFPNLYYLNNPTQSQKFEKLPTKSKTMEFQFTERGLFDISGRVNEFDLGLVGDFMFSEVSVRFQDKQKLSLISPEKGSVYESGEKIEVRWNPSEIGEKVVVKVAKNPYKSKINSFRLEVHGKSFDWITLGEEDMGKGKLEVELPNYEANTEFNLMISSSNFDDEVSATNCFFFDLAIDLTIADTLQPTSFPTFLPTASPTEKPTQTEFPSPHPTEKPTISPTSLPTESPTSFPTYSPTSFVRMETFPPTSSETSFPTKAPTPSPTSFPSKFPTAFPTESPPTQFPTSQVTPFPTTSSPTLFPTTTNFPTTFSDDNNL